MSEPLRQRGQRQGPIVLISSYPPRPCGIATFTEELVEFLRRRGERPVEIISHLDGRGPGVHPVIDLGDPRWDESVADLVEELRPSVVHVEHEYGLYLDRELGGHRNNTLLRLLERLSGFPIVVEPHTLHGRLREYEIDFFRQLVRVARVVLVKCDYQRERLWWNLGYLPENVVVVPHGARGDQWQLDPDECRRRMGFDDLRGRRVVALVGWIQRNKRWDLVLDRWTVVREQVRRQTGEEWMLLAAGNLRDLNDAAEFRRWRAQARALERAGVARYYQFEPRGQIYYDVMGCADVVALPTVDETQSGTLARVFALCRPYLTYAPMEGLTSQTVESGGGLLFSEPATLERGLLRLMTEPALRAELSANLQAYLPRVNWDTVVEQYRQAHEQAIRLHRRSRRRVIADVAAG